MFAAHNVLGSGLKLEIQSGETHSVSHEYAVNAPAINSGIGNPVSCLRRHRFNVCERETLFHRVQVHSCPLRLVNIRQRRFSVNCGYSTRFLSELPLHNTLGRPCCFKLPRSSDIINSLFFQKSPSSACGEWATHASQSARAPPAATDFRKRSGNAGLCSFGRAVGRRREGQDH